MKKAIFTSLVSAAALTLLSAAPVAVSADNTTGTTSTNPQTAETTVGIQFGGTEGPTGPVDPTDPGTGGGGGTGNAGPLSLDAVPTALNFGKASASANTDQVFTAAHAGSVKASKTAETTQTKNKVFVQVTDNRTTASNWTLSVIGSDLTDGASTPKKLAGATIDFTSTVRQHLDTGAWVPNAPLLTGASTVSVDMVQSSATKAVMVTTGLAGTSQAVWDTSNIKLNVPRGSAAQSTEYQGTLTWTLSTTAAS